MKTVKTVAIWALVALLVVAGAEFTAKFLGLIGEALIALKTWLVQLIF